MALTEIPIAPLPPERFRALLGTDFGRVEDAMVAARELFHGRVVWHVNSTARGGGVVELLTSLLAYARGAGVDNRWAVIGGDEEFFRLTKRIHNRLHGATGDGGALGPAEHAIYERTLGANATDLLAAVRPVDVVFLHDPQTAGLIAPVADAGATVVWRCHVGLDLPNDAAREAWDFLRGYVGQADAFVFSRREFAWEGLPEERTWIVPPSIDAFSPKNQELDGTMVESILAHSGIQPDGRRAPAVFVREDGSPGRVDRHADLVEERALTSERPLVTQVSRWDRLKDPIGLIECFATHCADLDADLLVAGPSVEAVADDPEGVDVLAEATERWRALPDAVRARVRLACLPMADVEENAAIVNALQRRSDVVVQKSLAEGFGLTVAEAMWKSRPVVASRVGGIQEQIVDGESGVLIEDPRDLDGFAAALGALLADRERAQAIGQAARERVREEFLGTRHLVQYYELLAGLLQHGGKRQR
jgi:trehalose synthase